MALTGLVHEVVTEGISAALVGSYLTGSSDLTVDNASQFPLVGTVVIENSLDGLPFQEENTYSIDPALPNVLTMTGGTTSHDYIDGSTINLIDPVIPTTTVYVNTDPVQPPIGAIAPQNLVVTHADALADGPRDPGTGVPVLIEEIGGVYKVTQVFAPPAVDGPSVVGPVPGDTLPPGVAPDGITPQDARVITVSPFAVGAVRADWLADTTNENPVYYKVYSSLTTPVVRDSTRLVGLTSGTNFQISEADGVLIPIDVSENPVQPTVHVVIESWDVDGVGAVSNEDTAQVLTSDAMITAHWVKALEIEAQQIVAGVITANLGLLATLNVGGYVVIDGVSSIITIYADVLHTIPLVQLRPDGSVFQGRIIATDISVLNGLILTGVQSQIAQGAVLTLQSSVADPGAAPTLSLAASPATWPSPRSGYSERGIFWDTTDTVWLRLLVPTSGTVGGNCIVEKITAAGAHSADVTLANISGVTELDMSGVVRHGSSYYSCVWGNGVGGTPDGWITQWTTAGAYVNDTRGTGENSPSAGTTARSSTCGYSGTEILMTCASTSSPFTIQAFTPGTLANSPSQSSFVLTGLTALPSTNVSYIGRGSFDFGANRFVVVEGTTVHVYSVSGAFLTEIMASTFSLIGAATLGGVGWDGTSFFSTKNDSKIYKYPNFYPSASQAAYVTYYDQDAGPTHWTLDSPPANILLAARRYVQAALAPTGSSASKVLMGLGTSLPADSALLLRPETVTSQVILIDPSVAGGAVHPTLKTVTNKALTSNVATLTTSAAHGYAVGHEVLVSGVDATFNGTYVVTVVGSTTTFSYAKTAANVGSTASGGLVEANTFGAGVAGILQSQVGGFMVKGDGSGGWFKQDQNPVTTVASATTTTETVIAKFALPAGYWDAVNRMALINILAQAGGTATVKLRCHYGPLGTASDPTIQDWTTSPALVNNQYVHMDLLVFATALGGAGVGKLVPGGFMSHGVGTLVSEGPNATVPAFVDTTVDAFLTITVQLSAANTLTVHGANMGKQRG